MLENDEYYLLENGKWIVDSNRIILGKLIGYDEYEPDDSPYKTGSMDVLKTIEHLTEKEFAEQYHSYMLQHFKE